MAKHILQSLEYLSRNSKLLTLLGLSLVLVGAVRLHYSPTIPSFRLMEIGVILAVLPHIPISRPLAEQKFTSKRIAQVLVGALVASFLLRSLYNVVSPLPAGADTATYMFYAAYVAKNLESIPAILFFHTSPYSIYFEPFVWIVFGVLVRIGFPLEWIPQILVPLVSTVTILPFYRLVARFKGTSVALPAALLLSVAPLQLRFSLDLFRNVFGNLFMICAFYFILFERRRVPWKSICLVALLAATYQPSFLLFLVTIVAYLGFGHPPNGSRRNLLIALIAMIPLGVPAYLGTGGLVVSFLHSIFANITGLLHGPFDWQRGVRDASFPFSWSFALVCMSIPLLISTRRRDFFFFYVASVMALVALFVLGTGYGERWGDFVEFGIAAYAGQQLATSKKGRGFLPIAVAWVFFESVTFIHEFYRPCIECFARYGRLAHDLGLHWPFQD